jgi:hypothetical protein
VVDPHPDFLVHEIPPDIVEIGLAFRRIDLKRDVAAAETVALPAGRLRRPRYFLFFRLQLNDLLKNRDMFGDEKLHIATV